MCQGSVSRNCSAGCSSSSSRLPLSQIASSLPEQQAVHMRSHMAMRHTPARADTVLTLCCGPVWPGLAWPAGDEVDVLEYHSTPVSLLSTWEGAAGGGGAAGARRADRNAALLLSSSRNEVCVCVS